MRLFLGIFLCHKATEVDGETGGPESTAGAMYKSELGMQKLRRKVWL